MKSTSATELQAATGSCAVRSSVLAVVSQPALIGCVCAVGLNWLVLATSLSNDQYEGADATSVRRFLSNEYHSELLRALGLTFAASATLGLVLGTLVGLAIQLRRRWLGLEAIGRQTRAAQTLAGFIAVYLLVWADDVIGRPALYQDFLRENGSGLAAFQVFLTDRVGSVGLRAFAAGMFLLWMLWPAARRYTKLQWRPLGIACGVLAAGILLLLAPWREVHSGQADGKASDKLNVLIVAADSLRPDRITPSVAPHLSALKNQGVDFSHAYTPIARTFPAWVSLLTGNYPHHHGVRNMFPRWETRMKGFRAVPESFRTSGYTTAVVSDFAGDIFRRIELGFQHLHTPTLNMRELLLERILQKDVFLLPYLRGSLARWAIPVIREMHVASDAQMLTADALSAIDEMRERPFFLTVFYSTTHFPYAAPNPYYRKFTDPTYSGAFRYAKADTLNADAALSSQDVLQTRRLFDGAVSAVDTAVGDLMKGLTSRGLREHTLIVVTADHGETLYEYGRGQGHGDHLFGDENLHVPLIVLKPGSVHASVPANVSLVDLAPTLCELTQVACSLDMDGRSLAEAVHGKAIGSRPVFAETGLWFTETIAEVPLEHRIPYPDLLHLTEVDRSHVDEIVIRREWEALTTAAKHRMIREGNFKLIYMPTRRGPKTVLFDTANDPGEVLDVSSRFPEVTQRLRSTLLQWILTDATLDSAQGSLVPRSQPRVAGTEQ
jgi:arylsulfatase A-like enzyme